MVTGHASRGMSFAILATVFGLLPTPASGSYLVQRFAARDLHAAIDTASDVDWAEARWLVPGKRNVWIVDVGSRQVRVFEDPQIRETASAVDVNDSTEIRTLRRTVFEPSAAWPWPEPLRSAPLSETDLLGLTVAPFGEDSAWLVDATHRRAWRLEAGEWRRPIILGEPTGGVTAQPAGGLVIDTPESPTHAHALLDPSGEVLARFGERLEPPRDALDDLFNRWMLATARNGDILAAHRYLPLLRRYDRRGKLRWAKALEVHGLDSLASTKARIERLLEVNERGCFICRLTLFATAITETRDGRIAISFSGQAALRLYSEMGRFISSAIVGQDDLWQQAGFASSESWMVAFEPRGVFTYLAGEVRLRLEGQVQTAERNLPIAGATVGLILHGAMSRQTTTDDEGRFRVPDALPADARGQLTVDASGYLRVRLEGSLASLVAAPILLEPAPQVCVEVVDSETAAPIPRYELSLLRDQRSAGASVRTGGPSQQIEASAGHGCVAAPWRPPWLVRVESKGYASAEERVASTRDEAVQVSLHREARAVVTVESGDGDPVEAAEIVALAAGRGKTVLGRTLERQRAGHAAVTDSEGLATLEKLMPGAYQVEVTHGGFLPETIETVLYEGDNLVSSTLSAGARAEVLVTSKRRDAPIEGAEVRVDGSGRHRGGSCSSGSDGRCSVRALVSGSYVVRARAEGFTPGLARLAVQPEQSTVEVKLKLRSGVELDGLVLGMGRYPETRFEVRVSVVGVPVIKAPVGPDGRFRFAHVPSGEASVLVVEAGTLSIFAQKETDIPAEGPVQLTLELPPRLTVSGRVTVEGRLPCGGCVVVLAREGAEVGATAVERPADPDGRYAVHLPARGVYRVTIVDSVSGASLSDYLEVDTSMTANWTLSGGEVYGRIYDEHGEAVAGALVELRDRSRRLVASTASGGAGGFRFEGLVPGRYEVVATAAASSRELAEILRAGHSEEVEIFLPPAEPLRVRLRAMETREPILLASARVEGPGGDVVRTPPGGVRAGEGGIFHLPVPASRPWTLVVTAPGYAISTVTGLDRGGVVDLALPRGHSFSVDIAESIAPCAILVEDRSGRPISLGMGFAPGPAPLFVRQAMFNFVPGGEYRVTVVTCDGERLSTFTNLAPGTAPQLRFG